MRHMHRSQPEALTRQSAAKQNGKRKGFLSAELVLVLPIFALVLFGLFEFSMLFFARGELAEATRAGARKASMPGVSTTDVEAEVKRVLSPRYHESLEVAVQHGIRSGDVVTVGVAVDMNVASPDLLWPIGYSLKNRKLYEATRMIRE